MLYKEITSVEYFRDIFPDHLSRENNKNCIVVSKVELLELGKYGDISIDGYSRLVLSSDVYQYIITKLVDDWFYIIFTKCGGSLAESYLPILYKCDQIDGLASLIKDKTF